jgi:hypothetical protein
MKKISFGNDPDKILLYRKFWDKENNTRPLIGISKKGWFPVQEFSACKIWKDKKFIEPEDIIPEKYVEDQRNILREGEIFNDDIIRGASPFQGIGWLAGMLGLRIHNLKDSTVEEFGTISLDEIVSLELSTSNKWYKKYFDFLNILVNDSQGEYPVSHANLSGPTDLFYAFRKGADSIFDVIDQPEQSQKAIFRFGEIIDNLTRSTWEFLPKYNGGFFDAQYQLWAPASIIRIQEDATSLFSPETYMNTTYRADTFMASRYAFPFMHLHSTQLFLLNSILSIKELKCIQINYEAETGGSKLEALIPYLLEILKTKNLILRGRFSMDEVRLIKEKIPPQGFYLYCMVESNEEGFHVLSCFNMDVF